MKLVVCGSRSITKSEYIFYVLDRYPQYLSGDLDLLIQGAATGADTIAGQWAKTRGVTQLAVPADWKRGYKGPGTYDRSAGFVRNSKMLGMLDPEPDLKNLSDEVIAFVDKPLESSKGTLDTITKAKNLGLTVHVFRVDTQKKIPT